MTTDEKKKNKGRAELYTKSGEGRSGAYLVWIWKLIRLRGLTSSLAFCGPTNWTRLSSNLVAHHLRNSRPCHCGIADLHYSDAEFPVTPIALAIQTFSLKRRNLPLAAQALHGWN